MEKIILSKIEVLATVSVAVATDGTSALVYKGEVQPQNIKSDNCSPDLFSQGIHNYLGLKIPYIQDAKQNKFMFLKDIAIASGRKLTTVDQFFRKSESMIKVGYRPKHWGGAPSKTRGLEHVSQNLVPLLHAMQYLRNRPEVKKGKK